MARAKYHTVPTVKFHSLRKDYDGQAHGHADPFYSSSIQNEPSRDKGSKWGTVKRVE